jgi:capsular exopolysaccharide synthesis family protein
LLAGLGGGIGLVYVLDILDDRFRSPEELRSQLGAPVLAMVRQMDDLQALGLQGIHVHVTPDAVTSEAFRTLRTTLAFAQEDTTRMVISSAEPGDGKTTVMANLAVSFVQSGKKTLLIDADLRRPGLTNLMGMKGQSGLTDLLSGAGPVPECASQLVRQTDLAGFDFLPAGPRRPNPAELLNGSRLADLLAWAESIYDQILIDSPPALAASDASIIGRLVDGVVLVVQPRKNQRRLVLRAAESFTSLGVNLLGVVVNRVTADKADAIYGYSSYGYGYGYGYGDGYGSESESETQTNVVPMQPAGELTDSAQVPRRVA